MTNWNRLLRFFYNFPVLCFFLMFNSLLYYIIISYIILIFVIKYTVFKFVYFKYFIGYPPLVTDAVTIKGEKCVLLIIGEYTSSTSRPYLLTCLWGRHDINLQSCIHWYSRVVLLAKVGMVSRPLASPFHLRTSSNYVANIRISSTFPRCLTFCIPQSTAFIGQWCLCYAVCWTGYDYGVYESNL